MSGSMPLRRASFRHLIPYLYTDALSLRWRRGRMHLEQHQAWTQKNWSLGSSLVGESPRIFGLIADHRRLLLAIRVVQ